MMTHVEYILKSLVCYTINIFVTPTKKITPDSLLIIRLDAIGDYVLFRNYIEILKKSDQYKKYKITLVGNSAWKDMSEALDGSYIDKFIWLDRDRFNKDLIYTHQKLQEITANGYEIVLNPAFSRNFFYDDNIAKLIQAKKKVASNGGLSNIMKWQKKMSDRYYNKLIETKNELMFEFDRNKEFFEGFLEKKITIDRPTLTAKSQKLSFELPSHFAILFIGASNQKKRWSIDSFAQIARWLKEHFAYQIVVCGARSDESDGEKFHSYFGDNYTNLVGKTSLMELIYITSQASLLISNDTSAPHLAVGLGVKNIFVLYSGNHYGRFCPYPAKMAPNYHAIFHPEVEKGLDNYKKTSNFYGYESTLDINEISVKRVKEKIGVYFTSPPA